MRQGARAHRGAAAYCGAMTISLLATARLEIAAVLARHAYAADHQDASLLRTTIAPNARIATLLDPLHPALTADKYVSFVTGSAPGRTRETVLRNALITVDGDTAKVVGELGFVELELRADGT